MLNQDNAGKTPTPKQAPIYAKPNIPSLKAPKPKKVKKAMTPTPKKVKTPQIEKATTPTPKKIKTPKTATPSEAIKASILKTADSPATPADGKKLKVRILEPKTPKTPKAPKSPKSATKFSPRVTRSKTPKK
jgi:hypothetical protein